MIRKNISLKKYNSFNIDVNAKEFVEVNSKDELIEIANKTKDKNVLYLGGGSNIYSQGILMELLFILTLRVFNLKKQILMKQWYKLMRVKIGIILLNFA